MYVLGLYTCSRVALYGFYVDAMISVYTRTWRISVGGCVNTMGYTCGRCWISWLFMVPKNIIL